MSISFSGLASGLDTSSWVESLVALKRAKVTTLQEQKQAIGVSKNTLNSIRNFFNSFRATLEKITDTKFNMVQTDLFAQNIAASANLNVLTATANAEAEEGTHKVKVDKIATKTKVTSGYKHTSVKTETTLATDDTKLKDLGVKSGVITVNNGVETNINITDSDTIATFIDKLKDAGVEASYNEKTGIFTLNAKANVITNEGTTGIKDALHLEDVDEAYVTQDKLETEKVEAVWVQADANTFMRDLGVNTGTVTIKSNDVSYDIEITENMKLGEFVSALQDEGIDAYLDDGVFVLDNAEITNEGTTNIISALGFEGDIYATTQRTDNMLVGTIVTSTTTATEATLLKDLGSGYEIADDANVIVRDSEGNYTTIDVDSETSLGALLAEMKTAGLQATLKADGTVEISDGVITGGTFDAISALNLGSTVVTVSVTGSSLTETAAGGKANATLLSELGNMGLTSEGTAEFNHQNGSIKTIDVTFDMSVEELMGALEAEGIESTWDSTNSILTIKGATILSSGTSNLSDVLNLTEVVNSRYISSNSLFSTTTSVVEASGDTLLSAFGINSTQTVYLHTEDGNTASFTVDGTTNLDALCSSINAASTLGEIATLDGGVLNIQNGYIENDALESALGLNTSTTGTSSVLGTKVTYTITATATGTSKLGEIISAMGTSSAVSSGYNLSFNGQALSVDADTSVDSLLQQIGTKGGTGRIDVDGTIHIDGGTLTGTVATALGFTSDTVTAGVSTVGTVLHAMTTVLASGTTTMEELGCSNEGVSVYNADNSLKTTIATNTETTINALFGALSSCGITATIAEGVITFNSPNGVYIVGVIADALGISKADLTTDIITTTTGNAVTSGSAVTYTSTVTAEATATMAELGINTKFIKGVEHKTSQAGYTAVSTREELATAMATGSNIILMNDIDLSGSDWSSISSYSGTLDGNGYVIKNMTTSSGFIGNLSGSIKNLGFENATATGGSFGAGVIANVASGTIENCYVSSSSVSGQMAGGLVGNVLSGALNITDSAVYDSTITGTSVGGLVGDVRESSSNVLNVTNSSVYGTTLSGTNAGGILGELCASATCNISDSTVDVTISSGSYKGIAIGLNSGISTINGLKYSSNAYNVVGYSTDSSLYVSNTVYSATTAPNNVQIRNVDNELVASFNLSDTSTINDLITQLAANGVTATLSNGVISVSSDSGYYLTGGVIEQLGMENITNNSATVGIAATSTALVKYTVDTPATLSSKVDDYDGSPTSRELNVYNSSGTKIGTVTVSTSMTFSGLFSALASQTITCTLAEGVISATSSSGNYVDGEIWRNFGFSVNTITTQTTVSSITAVSTTSTSAVTYTTPGVATNSTRIIDMIYKFDGSITASGVTGSVIAISTAEEMVYLQNLVNAGNSMAGKTFVLTSDVDLSSVANWEGIGKSGAAFAGTFDGAGLAIYYEASKTLNSSSTTHYGLFGYVKGATIKNIWLDGYITVTNAGTANAQVGLLVGAAKDSTIYGIHAESVIEAEATSSQGNFNLGGLIGLAENTSVTDCEISWMDLSVSGTAASNIGGAIGWVSNANSSKIDSLSTQGDLYNYTSGSASGVIGAYYNQGCTATVSNIDTSAYIYATGNAAAIIGDFKVNSTGPWEFNMDHVVSKIADAVVANADPAPLSLIAARKYSTIDAAGTGSINLNHCYAYANESGNATELVKNYYSYTVNEKNSSGACTEETLLNYVQSNFDLSKWYAYTSGNNNLIGMRISDDYTLTVSDSTNGSGKVYLPFYGIDDINEIVDLVTSNSCTASFTNGKITFSAPNSTDIISGGMAKFMNTALVDNNNNLVTNTMTSSTTFEQLGGEYLEITLKGTGYLGGTRIVTVSGSTTTVGELMNTLEEYGFDCSISSGKLTVGASSEYYISSIDGDIDLKLATGEGKTYSTTSKTVDTYTKSYDALTMTSSATITYQVTTTAASTATIAELVYKEINGTITASGITGDVVGVYDAQDLIELRDLSLANPSVTKGKTFVLMGNIYMNDVNWTQGITLTEATFDGMGHTISGFNIDEAYTGSSMKFYGLFSQISDSTLKNVNLSDVGIDIANDSSSEIRVGSLVGVAYNSTISGVRTEVGSHVTGSAYIGGVIGQVYNSNLSKITSNTSITHEGQGYAGGIVGWAFSDDGNVYDSLQNDGEVNTTSTYAGVGGIIGFLDINYGTLTVSNTLNKGAVSAGYNVSGIIGAVRVQSTATDEWGLNIENSINRGSLSGGNSSVTNEITRFDQASAYASPSGKINITNCYATGSNNLYSVNSTFGAFFRNIDTTGSETGLHESVICSNIRDVYNSDKWSYYAPSSGYQNNCYLLNNNDYEIIVCDNDATWPTWETITLTGTDTIDSLLEYMEGYYGDVTYTNGVLNLASPERSGYTTSESMFLNTTLTTAQTQTVNADTTFGELGLNSTTSLLIRENTNLKKTVTVKAATTLGEFVQTLNDNGLSATLADGKITIGPNQDGVYIQSMTKKLAEILHLESGSFGVTYEFSAETVYSYSGSTTSDKLEKPVSKNLLGTSVFGEMGISGTSTITVVEDGTEKFITVDEGETVNDLIAKLGSHGIEATVSGNKFVIEASNSAYIKDMNSQLADALGLSGTSFYTTSGSIISGTGNSNTLIVDETVTLNAGSTTFGELGATGNVTMEVFNGTNTTVITMGTSNSFTDLISKLQQNGIAVTPNYTTGKITLTPVGNAYISNLGTIGQILNLSGSTYSTGTRTSYSATTDPVNSYPTVVAETTTKLQNLRDANNQPPSGYDIIISKVTDGVTSTVTITTLTGSSTIENVIGAFEANGLVASLNSSGQLEVSAEADSGISDFDISGTLGTYLMGSYVKNYDNITTINTSNALQADTGVNMEDDTWLGDLGITSGNIKIYKNGEEFLYEVDAGETLNDVLDDLYITYGIDSSVSNGKLSLSSNDGVVYLESVAGGSNFVDIMGVGKDNWSKGDYAQSSSALTDTKTTVVTATMSTTIADLKASTGVSLGITAGNIYAVQNGEANLVTIDTNETLTQLEDKLDDYGITFEIDASGKLQFTSTGDSYLTTDGIASGASNILEKIGINTTWDANYDSVSGTLQEDTTQNVAITPSTKLVDINEGTFQAGYITVVKDGVSTDIEITEDDTVESFIQKLMPYGFSGSVSGGKVVIKNNGHAEIKAYSGANTPSNVFEILGINTDDLITTSNYQSTSEIGTDSTTSEIVAATEDTLLSDLGVTTGEFRIYKNGVKYTATIEEGDTLGSLMETLESFGLKATLVDTGSGAMLSVTGSGDAYVTESPSAIRASNVIEKLFTNDSQVTYSYNSDKQISKIQTTFVTATEETLLSEFDDGLLVAEGDLSVTIDGKVSTIRIDATDTIGSLIDKISNLGVNAAFLDGNIIIDGASQGFSINSDGTTSSLQATLKIVHNNAVDNFASSSVKMEQTTTIIEERTDSIANFADKTTTLGLVGISNGVLSVYRDGQRATIEISTTQTFEDLEELIKNSFAEKDIKLDFEDGHLRIYSETRGVRVEVGSTTDKSNFVSITGISTNSEGKAISSKELYCVNVDSVITTSGIFRLGDVREGTFTIGDEEFEITNTTTLAGLISQINASEKAGAVAMWDSVGGKLIIESRTTGASLLNIEAGSSNFTDIMGLTKSTWADTDSDGDLDLVSTKINLESQEIGENAQFTINGTEFTSTSNTIDSSISRIKGLTLNLKDVSDEEVLVTVKKDDQALANAVEDVVEAYNELIANVDAEIAKGSPLDDQFTLKLIRNQIRTLMTSSIQTTGAFNNIGAVGISYERASANNIDVENINVLSFDKDKFLSAFNADRESLKKLLVGDETYKGVFQKVEDIVESAVAGVTGYFASAEKSYDNQIAKIETQIEKAQRNADRYKERLEAKFQAMDLMIQQMQDQYSSFLGF